MIYGLIEELSSAYPIRVLCTVLGVSKSAYYEYVSGKSGHVSSAQSELLESVLRIFTQHKRRYGSRRIMLELEEEGFKIGRDQVRSLMRKLSLKAIQPRSFVPRTTQADPSRSRSPNLLLSGKPLCHRLREVIVGDITYWPSDQGWLYLAVWMDLFSRRILGWKVSEHMRAELITEAFEKVLRHHSLAPGTIVHSDGGGQYKSTLFRKLIKKNLLKQSMTRIDNHYDNAYIESLFSRIKAELMDEYPQFSGLEQAQIKLFEYIDGYYNTIRRHSSIGGISPINFENQCNRKTAEL